MTVKENVCNSNAIMSSHKFKQIKYFNFNEWPLIIFETIFKILKSCLANRCN